MSFDALGDLNWLAVGAATLAYFFLGAVWYAPPVLGNAWMKAGGMNMEGESPSPLFYIAPLLFIFVTVVATALLAKATGSDTVGEGICLGLITGVGYAVMLVATSTVFGGKKPQPVLLFAINAAYPLIGFLLSAVIVSAWK